MQTRGGIRAGIRGYGLWTAAGVGIPAHRQALAQGQPPRPQAIADSCAQLRPYLPAQQQSDGQSQPAERLQQVIREALDMADLSAERAANIPLLIGSTSLDVASSEQALQADSQALPLPHPDCADFVAPLRQALGHRGPACVFSSACASAANALLHGLALLRAGAYEDVLVVGVEVFNRLSLDGFGALMLLSDSGDYRPFDGERDGIVLGEAAAAMVLSRQSDGAAFALSGGSSRCDPGNPTNATPAQLLAVMQAALSDAGVSAESLLAVRAHGTGTPSNDVAEGQALLQLCAQPPALTSLKPWFGHTLGASGLVELIALLLGWEQGFLPSTPGFRQADPETGVQAIAQALPLPVQGAILCNSFGFGGNNASLVVEACA